MRTRRAYQTHFTLLLFALAMLTGCGTRSSEEPPAAGSSPRPIRDMPRKLEPRLSDDLPPEQPVLRGSVSGMILLDGKPLDTGTVAFWPAEGGTNEPAATAKLNEGKYTIEKLPIGEYKISISSPRVVGKKKVIDKPDAKEEDILREIVPPRYNGKDTTLLKATIKEGANVVNFDLASR